MEENETAAALINELQLRTFRLKVAQTVLLVAVLIGVGFLVVSNYRLTASNKELQNENHTLSVQIKNGVDSIHQQFNCVLTFFSQPPAVRTNSSIAQPLPCLINQAGVITNPTTPQPPTQSAPKVVGVTPQPQPSVTPARQPALSSPPSSSRPPSASPTPSVKPPNLKQTLNLPSKILKKLGL